MESIVLQGDILYPDGWSEATVVIEDGRMVHFSDSLEKIDKDLNVIEGLILPGLLDMHTHLGDHGARGDLPSGLEETVFPGGIKHRFLERCTREELSVSIRRSLKELHAGATFVMDYREGGIHGISAMEYALYDNGPGVYSMGRPLEGEDPVMLVEKADGLGIPSLKEGLSEFRDLAKASSKPFSLHASELFREDIDAILDLKPDQLIHMVSGTRDDWRAVSDQRIPVVVCPRSNFTFNIDVPLYTMYNEGIPLCLGTDNSLSSMHDMFREMEVSWALIRKGGLSGTEAAGIVFSMAVGRTMKDTKLLGMLPENKWWWEKGWPGKGDHPNLLVAERPDDDLWKRDPCSFMVRFMDRSRLLYTGYI